MGRAVLLSHLANQTALPAQAVLLSAAARTAFSAQVQDLQRITNLNAQNIATVQNAFAAGYAATNILGGILADKHSPQKVSIIAMLLFSIATLALPPAARTKRPLMALAIARLAFGAASGLALPAAAAAVSRLPQSSRSAGVAIVFGCNNVGASLGLITGALLPLQGQWWSCFTLLGAIGLLVSTSRCQGFVVNHKSHQQLERQSDPLAKAPRPKTKSSSHIVLTSGASKQIVVLVAVHSILNWAFFFQQNWLPVILGKFGADTSQSASFAAIPWAIMSLATLAAGRVADFLVLSRGWRRIAVRRLMIAGSTLIPASCLLFLRCVTSASTAIFFIIICLTAHALSTNGYHAYVQDVAAAFSGRILGLTNTMSLLATIPLNALTGNVVRRTGSFRRVFAFTAAFYVTGAILFFLLLPGEAIYREGTLIS